MEYDALRPMTLASFLLAGGNNCDEFRDNFNLFINMEKNRGIDMWTEIDLVDMVPCFRMYPLWETWLIEKGYITPRKRYHVNQVFEIPAYEDRVYMITKVENGPTKVGITRISFSETYNTLLFFHTATVKDIQLITPEEFENLTSPLLGHQRHNMKEVKLIKVRRLK